MRWKFLLLLLVLFLIINSEAKILSSPESKVVDKFESGDSTETVGDDDKIYINAPKDVTLVNATLDIEGNNVDNVKIEIDNKILFENPTLNGEIKLDLINNVSTTCDTICRWKLDIKTDDEFTLKNLFINYTFTKTPLFIKYMNDVKWTSGDKDDAFDLDNYFYGSDIKYKNMSSKTHTLENIDVKIDSNNEVSFTASPRWEGTGYIYFVADDDEHTVETNEIKLIVGSGETSSPEKPFQFSPTNSTVTLMKGSQQIFAVAASGNFSVEWYLDENLVKSNSYTYVFDATDVKTYNLEVRIGSTKRVWLISVLEPQIVSPELPEIPGIEKSVCGNGIREEDEDCGNCPEDVKCSADAKCTNGKCVLSKEKGGLGSIILILLIFISVTALIILGIILSKKGKLTLPRINLPKIFKKKPKPEEEIIEKKPGEDLSVLKNYITENIKKGYKKEDLINAALEQGWNIEQINKILTGQTTPIKEEPLTKELEPLKNYIMDGIKKGYKKEGLINAALKIGWSKEQIDEVLKRL